MKIRGGPWTRVHVLFTSRLVSFALLQEESVTFHLNKAEAVKIQSVNAYFRFVQNSILLL